MTIAANPVMIRYGLPLGLIGAGFDSFIKQTSDLLLDSFSNTSRLEKEFIRKSYIISLRADELRFNAIHQLALREFMERLNSESKDPKIVLRAQFEKEQELVREELLQRFGNGFYGHVDLLVSNGEFAKDRWLQLLFNQSRAEMTKAQRREQKKLILESEDYALFRIGGTPPRENEGR